MEQDFISGRAAEAGFCPHIAVQTALCVLDEATSALDEGLEQYLYEMLAEYLPQTKVISVGHRLSLMSKHQYKLVLSDNGKWSLEKL